MALEFWKAPMLVSAVPYLLFVDSAKPKKLGEQKACSVALRSSYHHA